MLDDVLKELDKEILSSDLIQDNRIHFTLDNQIYCVRMPNQRELSLAEEIKNAFYIELIQRPNTLHKKQIKKILKEKQGIDVDEMQKQANDLEAKLLDLRLSLARKKDTEKNAIDEFLTQIEEIKQKRLSIVLEIAEYFSSSIESQVRDRYMEYLTFLCTDKCIDENNEKKYIKVWNKFEEFENDNTKVSHKAIGYLTNLILNI